MTDAQSVQSEALRRRAQLRRAHDIETSNLSAVLAMDVVRYEVWAQRLDLAERQLRAADSDALAEVVADRAQLLAGAINAISRLVRHIEDASW